MFTKNQSFYLFSLHFFPIILFFIAFLFIENLASQIISILFIASPLLWGYVLYYYSRMKVYFYVYLAAILLFIPVFIYQLMNVGYIIDGIVWDYMISVFYESIILLTTSFIILIIHLVKKD